MGIVYGTGVSDVLDASDGVTNGDDTVQAYGGDDTVYGLGGNDLLIGGLGGDYLYGGAGRDSVMFVDSLQGVSVNLLSGVGHGGTAEGDRYFSIENVLGSLFDDTITGNASDNFVYSYEGDDVIDLGDGLDNAFAGKGDDVLKGGGGDDGLYGDEDNDTLWGGDGHDGLHGGTGDDLLYGGAERDFLDGGAGADTYAWLSTSETGVTALTADFAYGFNAAEGDRLDLSGVDADVYTAGNQSFTFIGAAPFSGMPGEINYYYSNGYTYIQLQTGTSADVEGVIELWGTLTPDASWFVL